MVLSSNLGPTLDAYQHAGAAELVAKADAAGLLQVSSGIRAWAHGTSVSAAAAQTCAVGPCVCKWLQPCMLPPPGRPGTLC